MILAVVAIAVAAVAVAAAVTYELKVPHPAGSTATTYGTPLNYSQVASPAGAAQERLGGAPWTPDSIIGLGDRHSYVGDEGLVAGCTVVWENASTIVIPATPAGAAAGAVAFWVVASVNASGAVLLTEVTELSSEIVASNGAVVEGSCTAAFTVDGPIAPPVVGSELVAAAANEAGGSAFLSEFPGSTEEVALVGPAWLVAYSTCEPFATSGTGEGFTATFYASNGTLIGAEGPESGSC